MKTTTQDWLKTKAGQKNRALLEGTGFSDTQIKRIVANLPPHPNKCQCGAKFLPSDPTWRFNGRAWEHHHGYPIGHVEVELAPVQSTDEAKLNKTEKAYLAYLRMLKVPQLRIQAVTLKLADDCRFTADFTFVDENGRMTFVDVKGFQREDALIKIKMAAREFLEFRFVIVKKQKGIGWEITDVKP